MPRRQKGDMKSRHGFTLIEMLVVIAVLGVFIAIAAVNLRMPSAQLMTNDLQAFISQARLQAVKHNRPVAVTWSAANQSFSMRYNTSTSATLSNTCTSTTIIQSKSTSDYKNISISSNSSTNAMIWLPNGLLSTCNGPATSLFKFIISDGRKTLTLSVSLAGKVIIE
jgi:prepilin-type N-terminal cleavage/methylation domain-containing protein